MTNAERKKRLRDKALIQKQMMHLDRDQRLLARGILAADILSMRSLASLLEFAGESEVTNVLVEAGYQSLSKKAQCLALQMTTEVVEMNDNEVMQEIKRLTWVRKGSCELRPVVVPLLLQKASS